MANYEVVTDTAGFEKHELEPHFDDFEFEAMLEDLSVNDDDTPLEISLEPHPIHDISSFLELKIAKRKREFARMGSFQFDRDMGVGRINIRVFNEAQANKTAAHETKHWADHLVGNISHCKKEYAKRCSIILAKYVGCGAVGGTIASMATGRPEPVFAGILLSEIWSSARMRHAEYRDRPHEIAAFEYQDKHGAKPIICIDNEQPIELPIISVGPWSLMFQLGVTAE